MRRWTAAVGGAVVVWPAKDISGGRKGRTTAGNRFQKVARLLHGWFEWQGPARSRPWPCSLLTCCCCASWAENGAERVGCRGRLGLEMVRLMSNERGRLWGSGCPGTTPVAQREEEGETTADDSWASYDIKFFCTSFLPYVFASNKCLWISTNYENLFD